MTPFRYKLAASSLAAAIVGGGMIATEIIQTTGVPVASPPNHSQGTNPPVAQGSNPAQHGSTPTHHAPTVANHPQPSPSTSTPSIQPTSGAVNTSPVLAQHITSPTTQAASTSAASSPQVKQSAAKPKPSSSSSPSQSTPAPSPSSATCTVKVNALGIRVCVALGGV